MPPELSTRLRNYKIPESARAMVVRYKCTLLLRQSTITLFDTHPNNPKAKHHTIHFNKSSKPTIQ